ncbi:MAG: CPBP family intramembrane glutamic endopeptidase [Cyclobacteriaceae bacterium]
MKKSLSLPNRSYFLVVSLLFLLFFILCRGYGMLGGPLLKVLLPLGFLIMIIVPFLFLPRQDLAKIGIKRATTISHYFVAFVAGILAAAACHYLGTFFFGVTPDNWYVSIQNFYISNPAYSEEIPRLQLFVIFTVPALLFSPIGEELFFRGFFQECLRLNFQDRLSVFIECGCFGLIHLFHHGLVGSGGLITFYPISGILWVILMSLTAYLFLLIRRYTGSIYPAMVSHAGFNLSMNWFIFYIL